MFAKNNSLPFPDEVIIYLLSFLNVKDLMTFRLLSKYSFVVANKNQFWSLWIRKEFENKLNYTLSDKLQPYHDRDFYRAVNILVNRRIELYASAVENLIQRKCWNDKNFTDFEDLIILTGALLLQVKTDISSSHLINTSEAQVSEVLRKYAGFDKEGNDRPLRYNYIYLLGLHLAFSAKKIPAALERSKPVCHVPEKEPEEIYLLKKKFFHLVNLLYKDVQLVKKAVDKKILKTKSIAEILDILSVSNPSDFVKFYLGFEFEELIINRPHQVVLLLYLLPKTPPFDDLKKMCTELPGMMSNFSNNNEVSVIRLIQLIVSLNKNLPTYCSVERIGRLCDFSDKMDLEKYCDALAHLKQPYYLGRLEDAFKKWNIELPTTKLHTLADLIQGSNKAWDNLNIILDKNSTGVNNRRDKIIKGITHPAFEIMTEDELFHINIISFVALLQTNPADFNDIYSALKKENRKFNPSTDEINRAVLLINHTNATKPGEHSKNTNLSFKRKCAELEKDVKKVDLKKQRLAVQISFYKRGIAELKALKKDPDEELISQKLGR